MHQDNELVPFPERVNANFKAWLAQQQAAGRNRLFTDEQRWWLDEDPPTTLPPTSASRPRTLSYAPFDQRGRTG